jgi:hypothetical protein
MQAAEHALATASRPHPVAMAHCRACAVTFHQIAQMHDAGCSTMKPPDSEVVSGGTADHLQHGSAAAQPTEAAASTVSGFHADETLHPEVPVTTLCTPWGFHVPVP